MTRLSIKLAQIHLSKGVIDIVTIDQGSTLLHSSASIINRFSVSTKSVTFSIPLQILKSTVATDSENNVINVLQCYINNLSG